MPYKTLAILKLIDKFFDGFGLLSCVERSLVSVAQAGNNNNEPLS